MNFKEFLEEKWNSDSKMDTDEKGKYKDWTMDELRKRLSQLKDSGPHPEGTKEYEEENEIEFAIRAKTGWGKV